MGDLSATSDGLPGEFDPVSSPEQGAGPDDAAPYVPGSAAGIPDGKGARPRGALRRLVVGVGGLLAIGVTAVKLASVVFFAASAVAAAADLAFGGPWDHLSDDTQDRLRGRLETALGDTLNGLSEAEAAARLNAMESAGLPRLDDAILEERLRLEVRALEATDVQTCATFARTAPGNKLDDATFAALVGALTTDELGRWFDVSVSAVEAQARGSPPPRSVRADAIATLNLDLAGALREDDAATVQAITGGGTVSDEAACRSFRALYLAALRLPARDVATIALLLVSESP